jgi:hypothetical protein
VKGSCHGLFLDQVPYFEKETLSLCDIYAVCVPVNPKTNFWLPESNFMKLGIYIMASGLISTYT